MVILKTLDRYILRHFFSSLLVVTVAAGLTIIVINMVEELRDFIDHDVPLLSILEYYVYFAGWVIKQFTPVFVMLAVLFSVSMLARRNEILAMKAVGLSLYRIALPLWIVTLIISAGHFYYSEYVFPPANRKKVEIKKFTIEKRSRAAEFRVDHVYRRVSANCFYTMARFDVENGEGQDFRLALSEDNRITEIITADRLIYEDSGWVALNSRRYLLANQSDTMFASYARLIVPQIEGEPKHLAKRFGRPEDQGLEELEQYIEIQRKSGGKVLHEEVALLFKYSFPLASFIVVLISVPFAANPRRGGIGVSFAAGAGFALSYFVLFRILQSAAANGKVPDLVAAWGGNALFLLIGLVLMVRARK